MTQHGGDYGPYYAPQHVAAAPAPTIELNPVSDPKSMQQAYASAPPFSNDFPVYSAALASSWKNQEPDPDLLPSASSYGQPQAQYSPQFPSLPSYNPSPCPAEATPLPYPHPQPSSGSFYSYDPNQQAAGVYGPSMNPSSVANAVPNPYVPISSFSEPCPSYSASYQSSAAGPEQDSQNFQDNFGRYPIIMDGGYGLGLSDFGQDFNESNVYGGIHYKEFGAHDNGLGDGVYQYDGGRSEPYGARGTIMTKSPTLFDDYGRSISFPSIGKDEGGSLGKIARAVPKADANQDVKNGVQKFRVKLLPEGGGQSTMDVLCQVGLDGIHMLDPSTNRTLRIYPLESVTNWEVSNSSTFIFWSKSSVDIDLKRIRLQSNSYTTNTILDTVTAATVQLKEMGGQDRLIRTKAIADADNFSDQSAERKKGLVDWMIMIKQINEEKDHWVPDEAVTKCTSCGSDFGAFNRRHHCRNCGDIFCDKCTKGRIALTADDNAQPVRVCDRCMAEVTQRLSTAKEVASKPVGLQSHEDLARKLQVNDSCFSTGGDGQESKNRSKSSDGSSNQMREVACPICTVHLQVQVPASGSETIECGVCQNSFLVSAH